MLKRFFAASAAAVALALGAAGVAGAGVLPQIHTVANGTAGYYAVFGDLDNLGANVTLNKAAVNIGGVGQGGIGIQMCDPNKGFGIQLGLVSNGSTFSVDYATGILAGAAADSCVGNGVLANPKVLNSNLTAVPVGDTVSLYMTFRNVKVNGHWQGRARLQAMDLTSGFQIYTASVHTAPNWALTSAGAGIQQDTTGMSATTPLTFPTGYNGVTGPNGSGASNDVADFSSVFTDGFGLDFPGFGLAFAVPGALQVATAGGGLNANAAIVAPNSTISPTGGPSSSAFSVYAGQVLG